MVLGTAVGGIIILTNARTIMSALGVSGGAAVAVHVVIVVVWGAAVTTAEWKRRRASPEVGAGRTALETGHG